MRTDPMTPATSGLVRPRKTALFSRVAPPLAGALSLLLGLASWGAGAGKKKKPVPVAAAPSGDDMHIEGLMGELDVAEVERVIQDRHPKLKACYATQAARLHYLGGHAELKVRVTTAGRPRWVTVPKSSVGSWEVERCMVLALEGISLQPPKGGEGELTCPIDFAARTRVTDWSIDKVRSALSKAGGALKGCKGKATDARLDEITTTLYVGPGGIPTSVGFSAEKPLSDALGTCLRQKIMALHFDDPLGTMAKVSVPFADLFPRAP